MIRMEDLIMKKKIALGIMISVLCITVLAGCGTKNETKKQGQKIEKVSKNKISIDDLIYDAKSEIVDGERYVMLSLTNNSKYTITGFEVKYKVKPDVTDEQKYKFDEDLIENFELSDDDIDELKQRDISMNAETERVVEPGKTIDKINCYYFEGHYYLKNMDHFNLVEPDIVTVKFIVDGKINTMYYDYSGKSYSYDSETEEADEWSTGEYGDKIPKPDAEHITSDRDDEERFMFEAYGDFSMDDFNDYVEKCKEMGYTENESSFDGFYSADSKDGYNVYLNYEEKSASISGTIEKSENENE